MCEYMWDGWVNIVVIVFSFQVFFVAGQSSHSWRYPTRHLESAFLQRLFYTQLAVRSSCSAVEWSWSAGKCLVGTFLGEEEGVRPPTLLNPKDKAKTKQRQSKGKAKTKQRQSKDKAKTEQWQSKGKKTMDNRRKKCFWLGYSLVKRRWWDHQQYISVIHQNKTLISRLPPTKTLVDNNLWKLIELGSNY